MSTKDKEKKVFKKTKSSEEKPKKKIKKPKEKVEVEETEDDFFSSLIAIAKEKIEGVFVPAEGVGSLVEVDDWIPMPDPICEVLGDLPGLPGGHIVEVLGLPDSGKTTICTHALIGAQMENGVAVLLDSEHKYNIERAVAMGLNREKLIIIPADTIEEAFDKFVGILKIIRSREGWMKRKVVVAWDSVGSTPCENELNEKTKDHNMKAAQTIKAGLRRTRYFLRKTNASLLLINQVYDKQTKTPWEKKTRGCGGHGPEYFSSIRIECTRIGKVSRKKTVKRIDKEGNEVKKEISIVYGTKTLLECIKNHMAAPFRKVEVEIDRKGIVFGGRKGEL